MHFDKPALRWAALFAAGVVLLYGMVLRKLYCVQVKGEIGGIVKNAMEYKKTLPALRGKLLDRNGKTLAVSYPCWKIFVDPVGIETQNQLRACAELAKFKEFDAAKIYESIHATNGRYHVLGVTKNDALVSNIAANPVLARGVGREDVVVREYPNREQASHVIGAVNSSGVGLDGAEKVFDARLSGSNGWIHGFADAKRVEIPSMRKAIVPPSNGANVYLSIDRNIQDIVETALAEWCERTDAERGWVIVQDPRTGEILAMSSLPGFDPSQYGAAPAANRFNPAIWVNFEPGSIMKTLTFAAALETGIMQTNTLINVDAAVYAGRAISDHVSGSITLTEATARSSNRAAARVGQLLGRERLNGFFKAFGLGARTGVGLPGESVGILHSPEKWSELDLVCHAFGQGVSVTAIQMAAMYSALANDGKLLKPTILSRIEAASGEMIMEHKPEEIGRPISAKTARETTFMMQAVTMQGGTARRSRIPGYSVAGKTGTAQVSGRGGYNNTDYVASFAGFFPASAPEVVMVVGLYKARDKEVDGRKVLYHQGGVSAAPLFAQIGAEIARHLQIQPDRPWEIDGL